jgi:hypothetical protein
MGQREELGSDPNIQYLNTVTMNRTTVPPQVKVSLLRNTSLNFDHSTTNSIRLERQRGYHRLMVQHEMQDLSDDSHFSTHTINKQLELTPMSNPTRSGGANSPNTKTANPKGRLFLKVDL